MIRLLEQEPNPTILFLPIAKEKIEALVKYADKEAAVEGTVVYDEETNTYYIEDVFPYPQTVTAATVEMDEEKYNEWLSELDDDTLERKKFQMHSHVNMGVSPSSTDIECYENYIKNIDDFAIFMIMNKKHEYNIWLYNVKENLIYDKDSLDVDVLLSAEDTAYDWYCDEVTPNIVKPAPIIQSFTTPYTSKNYSSPKGYNYGGYGYGYY